MRMIEPKDPLNRLYVSDEAFEQMQRIPAIDAAPMPPCRMGEEAYGLKNFGKNHYVVHGKIMEMKYSDDMELMIRVKGACAGKWGETVFGNYEDALRALKGGVTNG